MNVKHLIRDKLPGLFAPLAAILLSGQTAPSRYAEGQVWTYHTRSQDTGSLLKIQKIDKLNAETVYHISVIKIHFARPDIAGILPHLPVSQTTLDDSVVALTDVPDAFPTRAVDDGIKEWRDAKGGVFIISVAQILDAADMTLATPPLPATSSRDRQPPRSARTSPP